MLPNFFAIHAPGRVNLIGEHTDHQGGYVLPACINLGITFYVNPRSDDQIRIYSQYFDEDDTISTKSTILPVNEGSWKNYVRGVVANYLLIKGNTMGANIWIRSDLPINAGVSSSAAMEIGMFNVLETLNETRIDDLEAIQACWQAENEFVGVRCGIMDQFIIRMGKKDTALLINCSTEEFQAVNVPENWSLLLLDTGVPRTLSHTPYNARIEECQSALRTIRNLWGEVNHLSEIDTTQLDQLSKILDPQIFLRVSHVVKENNRVLEFIRKIQNNEHIGNIIYDSHTSLRENFDVSWPEADYMVEMSNSIPGILGARMHGAGWGGSIILVIQKTMRSSVSHDVISRFKEKYDRK
ncbi:MAG: galactokinase, partial [Candidatus Kariarchaeaceae archaeon]